MIVVSRPIRNIGGSIVYVDTQCIGLDLAHQRPVMKKIKRRLMITMSTKPSTIPFGREQELYVLRSSISSKNGEPFSL